MKRNALRGLWPASTPISRLPVLLLPVLFQACSSMTGTPPTLAPKVSAPEQCLQSAPSLPPLADPTLAGAVRNHAEVAAIYWTLAEWHTCLIMFERGR